MTREYPPRTCPTCGLTNYHNLDNNTCVQCHSKLDKIDYDWLVKQKNPSVVQD